MKEVYIVATEESEPLAPEAIGEAFETDDVTVEMEGAPVSEVAKSENITANNAMVRLHRARKALQGRLVETCGACTEHGCLDCHCKE